MPTRVRLRRLRPARRGPVASALGWWVPVVTAAAVVVSSLGGLTALAVHRSAAAVSGQLDARAQDATSAAQAFVHSRVSELEQLVTSSAQRPDVQAAVATGEIQGGPGALTAALHQLQVSSPGLVAAWVSDEHGTILTTDSGTATTIGQDLSYRDWYRGARDSTQPHLSPGFVNKNAARTAGFAVSVAVRAPGGRDAPVVGVLGTSMTLEAFEAVFADAAPRGGSMVVTDQLGQVLASAGLDQPPLSDRSADPGVREAISGRTTLHRSGDRVQVHAPLGRGWTISTSLPASLATEPNTRLARSIGVAGAVTGLFLLTALVLLAWVLNSRTQAQRALAAALVEVERRRRYTDTVLDTLDVSVVVCDTAGVLTYFNQRGREWHGIDERAPGPGADSRSTRHRTTHVDGSAVADHEWPLVQAMTTRRPASAELLLDAAGQPPRRILVLARPLLDADGTVLGAVAGAHDVTAARRQAAELQQARDTAMEASQAKTVFLAAMSHEIRTPLNGVLGMLELVLLDDALAPAYRDRLRVAASSGQTLLRLLNDVLDLSRSDASRLTLALRPSGVADLVRSAAAVLSGPAEAKGLTLQVVLDPALPERITTDPDRLTQILLNLVGNAVKFTASGAVTVAVEIGTAAPPPRADDPPQRHLTVTVTDTGPGMSAAERRGIFRPFEQGAAGRDSGGTGLGLALTSQLVELFGGTITVRSRPGRGSTFVVVLPVEVPVEVPVPVADATAVTGSAPPTAVAHRAAHRRLPPLRVLVAEDNEVNQLVVRHMLTVLGADVEIVDDGAQAVARVLSGAPFDVVLLDWQMPVLDGVEAACALRAAGVTLPVVGLTARTSPQDVETCLAAGMDRVLSKPCSLAVLAEALHEVTGAARGTVPLR